MESSPYTLFIWLIALTPSLGSCNVSYKGCQVLQVNVTSQEDVAAIFELKHNVSKPDRFDIWSHVPDSQHILAESLDIMVCPEVRIEVENFLKNNNMSWSVSTEDVGALVDQERVRVAKKYRCRGWRCTTTTTPPPPPPPPPPTTTTTSTTLDTSQTTTTTTSAPLSSTSAETITPATSQTTMPPGPSSTSAPPIPPAHPLVETYPTLEELDEFLSDMAADYPNIVTVTSIGNSFESRSTPMIRLQMGNTMKHTVYLDSLTHAREWVTLASVVYLVDRLLRNSVDTSSEEYRLLSTYDWYIIPVVNPDGYAYSYNQDRMWRKSRRPLSRGCYGVDLNRNYGTGWGLDSGSSSSPCDTDYRGTAAFSEPETANIQNFFLTNPTIQWNFTLSIHSYSQQWLYPWDYQQPFPLDVTDLNSAGAKAVAAIRAETGRRFELSTGYDIYPASGTTMDWIYGDRGVKYSYCAELRPRTNGQGGFILPETEIEPSGRELFSAVAANLKAIADSI